MRLVLPLLWIAATVAAEPRIRWIDKTGGHRAAPIASVVSENAGEVEVELAAGKRLKVANRVIVELVRENETDADQRDLLRARRDVHFRAETDATRTVLERLTTAGKEAWIREYAQAYRTVLAARTGEKKAAERIDAFSKTYPESRFHAQMILARTRLETRPIADNAKFVDMYFRMFDRIQSSAGPVLVALDGFRDVAQRLTIEGKDKVEAVGSGLNKFCKQKLEASPPDAALSTVLESGSVWMILVWQEHRRQLAAKKGHKPFNALADVEGLRELSEFLLPDVRSDVAYALGLLHETCGNPKKAKAAYAEAAKLAPDAWRRDRAARKARPQ